MKILMPVDGSDYSRRMLAYLAAHEELLGAGHDYTVIHVVPAIPAYILRHCQDGGLEDYYREQAEPVLRPVRAFVEQNKWNARLIHAAGHAPQVIAELAQNEGYGLIVMGTHGHSPIANMALGSVTTRVLAQCRVPVLLIR